MIKVMTMDPPAMDRREILRYMGAKEEDAALKALLDECIREADGMLEYRVVYTIEPISFEEDRLRFCNIETGSAALRRALTDCSEVLVFAATVGVGLDRLLSRYSRTAPSKALALQAIGAERIESLCNAFCSEICRFLQNENMSLRTRVSPGYGDISMEIQHAIFDLLDCSRKIGLTLNEQLMMSPSKSVTAFSGICSGQASSHSYSKCSACAKRDCRFRTE